MTNGVSDSVSHLQDTVLAVRLTNSGVVLLDQTRLPHEVTHVTVTTVETMIDAIVTMIVRGAPAIGVAGAYGMVLSARCNQNQAGFKEQLLNDAKRLKAARPTAVNLMWAIERIEALIESSSSTDASALTQAIEEEAIRIFEEDLMMCKSIGQHGKALVPQSARILTHCNAGALATAGYGTALGVIRAAFADDPTVQVYADETRPRLQGAKLTTWEMVQEGIPVTLISDNMSAWLMKQGKVDLVVVGADRIAANGDAANKIGTYLLALAAKAHKIPFYVAAPSSTVDLNTLTGDAIEIEERPYDELHSVDGVRICPEGVQFYNPAFDVTPANLITAIITEAGVFKPGDIAQTFAK